MNQLHNLANKKNVHNNHINRHKILEPGTSLYSAQITECQMLNFDLMMRVPFAGTIRVWTL